MLRITPRTQAEVPPLVSPGPRVFAEFSTEPAPGDAIPARWTRLRITRIGRDQYLCEKTRGPGPLQERSAVVSSLENAKAFFGGGWVVRELFAILDPVRFPRWP